jgi:diguanylate cyclase (GGDEF)-like protein
VVAARCTTERGWQVIVQRPTAAVARAVRELYALALGVAVLVGAAALVWARALAWRIARPLATLAAAVRAVAPGAPPTAAEPAEAGDLAVKDAGIAATDPRAPLEVRTLAAHLACMESRVGAADAALRAAVAAREGEIAARTRQLAEANDALARLASTDPLTGLLNRRGFDAIAERELATAHAAGTPCLLLYGDLDLFKQINDTHGHATGDTALVAFADVLRETFRVSDVVARLGGDEFAVLVYGAAASEEPRVRDRLDAALAALNATGPYPFTLAATFGAAPCEAARPRTLHALLREADTALYRGKRERRAQRAARAA